MIKLAPFLPRLVSLQWEFLGSLMGLHAHSFGGHFHGDSRILNIPEGFVGSSCLRIWDLDGTRQLRAEYEEAVNVYTPWFGLHTTAY